ncbi:MAG TPA: alpha/beta fold hydrolase [Thermoanaerobaculia bacterium]|nr:alpha/beta fold hydrolase [Thermoanaerobaculia bacterium]
MKPRVLAIVLLLLPLGLATDSGAGMGRAAAAAPGRGPAARLKPCRVPDVDEEVLCGRYEVDENRATRTGRKIGLNIVVLPAKTPDVAPDPLVFLAGGGVAPATRYAGFLNGALAGLRLHRDILLIDQRGSGASNPLECELSTDPANAEYRDEARFLAAVRRCRKQLERRADLRYYTTPVAMDDLDEVRSWLGYPRLDLYGVSYGTQAAMVYLRQHPDRVRSVVLHGVVPFDVPMWLQAPRSIQQALDLAFAACARQQGCHDAFPHLAQEFSTLLRRLAEQPVKVKVGKPEAGQEIEVPIDAEILRIFVVRMLYSAARIHDLPLLIHLAHAGDYQALARRLVPKGESEVPKGVYLSIVCNEEMHFDAAALPAAAAGTFLGGFRLGREILACREWVRGWLPKDYWVPIRSSVPALILTGALDLAPPPSYGERAARSFTNERHLVLPNRSHNDTDPCVADMEQAFVTAGRLEGLDTSCLAKTADLSFALRADELEQ